MFAYKPIGVRISDDLIRVSNLDFSWLQEGVLDFVDIGEDFIERKRIVFAYKPLFHRILIERNPHISSSIDTTGDGDAGMVTVMQVPKHLVENQWKQKRAKTLTSAVCTLHYIT